ncbi:hypothetical protein AEAC466_08510 [Asticcacaulis sp. AC466]|uniref:LPS-assembly protein LptD n=1 Tax=Asticcacaulis sp. AC466 TaxID=1282362 RepID=UPI0003C3AC87|nr:LPS assembly protein LptD [Asticcacaulis sp. AC466]ESQ84386.1 hypothetical protein AEAC466_08510 [Asticcacaulis sp. AC466]
MKKRYSLKLGAGLVSLMAMGVGSGGQAVAQTESAPATPSGTGMTGTQMAFELAMAQAASSSVAQNSVSLPSPNTSVPNDSSVRSETVPGTDGLVRDQSYVEADTVTTSDDGLVTAQGNAELRQNGRTIRADQITSNSDTGVTTATGHTQTIGDDGSIQYADKIRYDDNQQAGYSENFASVGKNNAKVFARRLEQISPDINRLTSVIYTPCALCVKHGETQSPTWSIEAGQITQRKDKKMVFYNNATVKIKGVPVLYSPYLWTPDPELDRASGFLPPKIGLSKKRGFSYEQPYLWSISPYSYLLVSPQLNTEVNPLLNMEYQRQFYSGLLDVRLGVTDDKFFDNAGEKYGHSDTRGYILADGAFKINPDWRWSFTAQHVRDRFPSGLYNNGTLSLPRGGTYANFFERYNIDGAFDERGGLTVDTRQLVNQFNLTRQVSNAYFAITMASFQSLQTAGWLDYDPTNTTGTQRLTQPYATNSDFYPTIAPQIEAYWSPRSRFLGGQLTASLSGIGIFHKELSTNISGLTARDIGAPALSDGVTGYDTTRASAGLAWYGDMTTRGGVKWGPFVDLRGDYYKVTDLDTSGTSGEISRGLGTAGVNLSYPLFRKFDTFTVVIEPIAQLAVSPRSQANPYLPTEDSQSLEFDETTLFTVNKSPGFDIYESGSRLNLGLRTELKFKSGWETDGLIGRVLRDQDETQFLKTVAINGATYTYDPSGLGRKNSDWIANASFKSPYGIYGYTRLRLDGESSRLSQGEVGLSAARANTTGTLRYIFNDALVTPIVINGKLERFGDNYRNMQLYARHFFTQNWGVSARLDRDLVANTWRRSTVSLIYRDDCSWFELVYQRNDSQLTRLNGKPSSSIFFRLNLTTLGTSPSNFKDVR